LEQSTEDTTTTTTSNKFIKHILAHDISSPIDYHLDPDIFPFPFPTEREDFEIPVEWTSYRDSFKFIKNNRYSSTTLNHNQSKKVDEDQFLCSCTPLLGCNENCINRLLYM
jgi:hypothetical protein